MFHCIVRVLPGIMILGLLVVAPVSASIIPYAENFETGFSDGDQLTDQGWTLAWTNDFTVGETSGKDGSWGAISNGAQAAIFTSHGSTFAANDLVRAEMDVKLDNSQSDANLTLRDSSWNYGMQVRFRLGEIRWCCQNTDDPDGNSNAYDYVGIYAINTGESELSEFVDQWFHIQVDWTVGSAATLTVKDENGASILMTEDGTTALDSATVDWSSWLSATNASTMQYINIGDSGGSAFDNLKISSIPEVPEPGCLALILSVFACLTAIHRTRIFEK